MIGTIIGLIVIGLIIGALARLVIPGQNPMPIWLTILVGIVGSLVGGMITAALLGGGHSIIAFIVGVVIAAVLVALLTGSRGRLKI